MNLQKIILPKSLLQPCKVTPDATMLSGVTAFYIHMLIDRRLTSPAECGCAKVNAHVWSAILDYSVHNAKRLVGKGDDAAGAERPQSVGGSQ